MSRKYSFAADFDSLSKKYELLEPEIQMHAAKRIKKTICDCKCQKTDKLTVFTRTNNPKQHNSFSDNYSSDCQHFDIDYESLLSVAAAALLAKLNDKNVTMAYLAHEAKMYYSEYLNDAKSNDLHILDFANKRYRLGAEVPTGAKDITVSFAGYVYCMPDSWEIYGRRIGNGRVSVSLDEVVFLAVNAIKDEMAGIFLGIKRDTIDDESLNQDALKKLYPLRTLNHSLTDGVTPPCMLYCADVINDGKHLPYHGRLALASFHGMRRVPADRIVKMFEKSHDYDSRVTQKQVDGILRKDLMPYSCEAMEQFGLCKRHDRCGTIKNPVSYK